MLEKPQLERISKSIWKLAPGILYAIEIQKPYDPWNYWFFNVGHNANIEIRRIEQGQNQCGWRTSISIVSRIKWNIPIRENRWKAEKNDSKKYPRVDNKWQSGFDEGGTQVSSMRWRINWGIRIWDLVTSWLKVYFTPNGLLAYDMQVVRTPALIISLDPALDQGVELQFFPGIRCRILDSRVNYGVIQE